MSFILRTALAHRQTSYADSETFWIPLVSTQTLYAAVTPYLIDDFGALNASSDKTYGLIGYDRLLDFTKAAPVMLGLVGEGRFPTGIKRKLPKVPKVKARSRKAHTTHPHQNDGDSAKSYATAAADTPSSSATAESSPPTLTPTINPSIRYVRHLYLGSLYDAVNATKFNDFGSYLKDVLSLFPLLEKLTIAPSFTLTPEILKTISSCCARLQYLRLNNEKPFEAPIGELTEKEQEEGIDATMKFLDLYFDNLPPLLNQVHIPKFVSSTITQDYVQKRKNPNFLRLVNQLQYLKISAEASVEVVNCFLPPIDSDASDSTKGATTTSKLRELDLDASSTEAFALGQLFLLLADRCPKLESLTLYGSSGLNNEDSDEILRREVELKSDSNNKNNNAETILLTRKMHERFLTFCDSCHFLTKLSLFFGGDSDVSFDSTCLKILAHSTAGTNCFTHLVMPLNIRICKDGVLSIAKNCTHLEELDVSGSNPNHRIDDEVLIELGKNCPNLKKFTLPYSTILMAQQVGPYQGVEMSSAGLVALAKGCKKLESFSLAENSTVDDEGVIALAENCPNMYDLSLFAMPKITDASLIAVANNLHKMKMFSVTQNQNISDVGIIEIGTKLKSLNFSDVSGTDKKKLTKKGLLVLHDQLGWKGEFSDDENDENSGSDSGNNNNDA